MGHALGSLGYCFENSPTVYCTVYMTTEIIPAPGPPNSCQALSVCVSVYVLTSAWVHVYVLACAWVHVSVCDNHWRTSSQTSQTCAFAFSIHICLKGVFVIVYTSCVCVSVFVLQVCVGV